MQDYCRSEELWFEDGNIVLEAEGIVFRVYRGNLARHSPVFAAMLSFPQPAQNELSESLDGCLIVHMPDAAEHLRYFLTALNDFGFSERIAKASLAEVNGVLRLAAKYDVAYLRLRAAARMRDWFPDSLDVFRRLGYTTGTPPTAEDLFASLEVSCAAGMHICLPVILFRICSVGLADILAPGNLDPATQLLVMEARETLSVRFHTEVWRWLYETPGCTAPLHCPQFRAKLSLRFEEVRFFTDFCKMFSLAPSAAQLACVACQGSLKTGMRLGQEKVWDALPEIFGLGTWDELRKAAAESERRLSIFRPDRCDSSCLIDRPGGSVPLRG